MKKEIRKLVLSYIYFFITGMIFFVGLFKRLDAVYMDPFYSNIFLSVFGVLFLSSIYLFCKNISFIFDKLFSFFDKR